MGATQQATLMGQGGAATAFVFLDTLVPTPRAVLSLRKYISTATNSIRVRRSSDNAEQDIGFSGSAAGSLVDAAAVASFAGAGSAFIVTVYDQTGNGEHATQATQAKQPRIYNAGSFEGFIRFDGTDDCLVISALGLGAQYVGIYYRAAMVGPYSAPNYGVICELSADAIATGGGCFASWFDGGTGRWTMNSNTGGAGAGSTRGRQYAPPWPSIMTKITTLFNTTIAGVNEIQVRLNSSTIAPAVDSPSSEQAGNYRSDQNLNIGSRNNGASLFNRMNLESMFIYNADSSGITATIESALP